jgi:hypothetical protein
MKFHSLNRITLPVALLVVGVFCPNLRAGWSSLQGNNRSAPARSSPRQQPQINRAPQVREPAPAARPEPQPAFHPQPQPEARPEQPREPLPPARPEPLARPEAPRQEIHPAVRVQPQYRQPVVAVARARAGEADRRRMNIDEDRSQSFFWSDYHRGMHVDRLPDGNHHFRFHDHDYFYFEGVYYDDEPSGYVVVDAPVDADVPDLPPGAETVVVNGTIYYYADGVFYVQQADDSYVVVAAPMGVTVSLLPPDAVETVVNGIAYYLADETYFLPVMQDGVTAYLTVQQP